MRYTLSYQPTLGETRIEITSNCYGDAFPLVKRIVFRNQQIDVLSQSAALACAVLTADYCGEIFEVAGVRLGGEYATAVQHLVGRDVVVANVDGMNRALSTRDLDVAASEGRRPVPLNQPQDGVPLLIATWSGDPVDRSTRSSVGNVLGKYQTNANLIASEEQVSIAVGLLASRDRCRNLVVGIGEGSTRLNQVQKALRIVGIDLSGR